MHSFRFLFTVLLVTVFTAVWQMSVFVAIVVPVLPCIEWLPISSTRKSSILRITKRPTAHAATFAQRRRSSAAFLHRLAVDRPTDRPTDGHNIFWSDRPPYFDAAISVSRQTARVRECAHFAFRGNEQNSSITITVTDTNDNDNTMRPYCCRFLRREAGRGKI